jgi:glycosyltransferase 2 family protein
VRKSIRTGILLSLALAFVVMTAIALYGDLPKIIVVLEQFQWALLPVILGLTLYNYGWRFIKWQYYLKRLDIHIAWRSSLLIFLSGLSMAITPGKVGELLKSYLLKRSMGAPISRTSPIIVSERLTDGIALVVLAGAGLVLYRFGTVFLLAVLASVLTGVGIIQNRRLSLALLGFVGRLPFVSHIAHLIRAFYESAYTLLQWRSFLLAIAIGIISWAGECAALYIVYAGLGLGFGPDIFIKSMFILSVSSLIGSASGLPGGLGTADGSMLGLTHLLLTASATLGSAAVLLIRLCTLWFGLAIGVLALLLYRSTQHADIFTERAEQSLPPHRRPAGPPAQADRPVVQTAATSSSIGERSV